MASDCHHAARATQSAVEFEQRRDTCKPLLHNAVRYTAAGGRVDVELSPGPPPSISVVDTGIGIAEEEVEKIFDRFHRVDRSRSRAEGGTGLGLAIAREIAHLHDAEIRVESQFGKGSRFTLVLDSGRNPASGKR